MSYRRYRLLAGQEVHIVSFPLRKEIAQPVEVLATFTTQYSARTKQILIGSELLSGAELLTKEAWIGWHPWVWLKMRCIAGVATRHKSCHGEFLLTTVHTWFVGLGLPLTRNIPQPYKFAPDSERAVKVLLGSKVSSLVRRKKRRKLWASAFITHAAGKSEKKILLRWGSHHR